MNKIKSFMKKIYSILTICLSFLLLPVFTGCVEEVELVEELNLPACLTPSSASASISRQDGKTVTFTWANAKGATQYLVEIYAGNEEDLPEDVFANGTQIHGSPIVVPAAESGSVTTMSRLLDADNFYFARVKAQGMAADGQTKTIEDSHWQEFAGLPLATYNVEPDVTDITVVERTANSVTLSWKMLENDTRVNQVRVTPNPDQTDTKDYAIYEIPSTVQITPGGTVQFTVGTTDKPLEDSHLYTFAVHYGSANRGEVVAWTRPDWTDAVEVATAAELKNAINEAGAPDAGAEEGATVKPRKIKLTNTEVPYEIGEVDIIGPVEITGEQTADGVSPTVVGTFNILPPQENYTYTPEVAGGGTAILADPAEPAADVTIPQTLGGYHLRLEALDLQGGTVGESQVEICVAVKETDMDYITNPITVRVLNCNISNYNKSVIYQDKSAANFAEVLFDGCYFEEMGTGQDGFDFRTKGSTISSFKIKNSTMANGFRCMVRVDKEITFNELVFDHNTLYEVGSAGQKGMFYVRSVPDRFELTSNIFMSIEGLPLIFKHTDPVEPDVIKSNFFYRMGEDVWVKDGFTQDDAIAGGGAVLSSDPCENAAKGLFNIKEDSPRILDAGAGDPRWLVAYVPEPEVPLTPVEADNFHPDLTDVATFYDEIDATVTRGNIKFFVNDDYITVSDNGMEFTAEATLNASNVPTDCALAFLVDKPGSVMISTAQSRSGSVNDHITVAYGPADGSSATVAGAVTVEAEGGKVAFPDIDGQTLIYIYGCGPIVLTDLMWVSDTSTGAPQPLSTPEPVIDNAKADATGSATLTWPAIAGAGSYTVTVTGPAPTTVKTYENIAEASFSLPLAEMTTGVYTMTVTAIAADMSRENSEPSAPVTFEKTEAWTAVSSSSPTTWDAANTFQYLYETRAGSNKDTKIESDFVYNNLNFLIGGGSCKFGLNDNAAGAEVARVQMGGGSTSKQALQIKVTGNGTLTVEAASSGTGQNRYVCVSVGDNQIISKGEEQGAIPDDKWGFSDTKAKIYSTEITGVAGETVISIYSGGSSINFFSITWTPEGYNPGATIPSDPVAVEVQTDFMTYFKALDTSSGSVNITESGASATVKYNSDDEVVFASKSDSDGVLWDGDRIKFDGKSSYADSGIPDGNYIMFKVTKPGTIKHYIRSGSTDPTKNPRNVKIDINKGGEVTEIYNAAAPIDGYKEGNETSTQITKEHLAGATSAVEVYISLVDNSCNVYYLEYIPDAE